MLGSQRPYFEKTELGYEKKENEKLSKNPQSKVPICIYYFKKGHSSKNCFFKEKSKEIEHEKAQKSY